MIWRLFAMLPLSSFLLNDHIVRWFAVNIPMSLVQGGGHGELDIIAKLKYPPRSKDTWFYRTWEVKGRFTLQRWHGEVVEGWKAS